MAEIVRDAIDPGEYASASDIMSEALSEWKLRRRQHAQAVDELGRLWDEGLASGPATDGTRAFKRLEARLAPGPIDK